MRKSLWQLDREAICLILTSIIAISVLTPRRAVFMEPWEGIADPQPSRGSRDHATGPCCPPSQPWCPRCQEAVSKRLLFTGLLKWKSSSNWNSFSFKWKICIFFTQTRWQVSDTERSSGRGYPSASMPGYRVHRTAVASTWKYCWHYEIQVQVQISLFLVVCLDMHFAACLSANVHWKL